MIEFLKNIIPRIIYYIGSVFNFLGKVLEGIAAIFYAVSTTIHMLFNTKTGKYLKDIDKTTQSIIALYNNIQTKASMQKARVEEEENKLAKIIKDNKNVVKLGNKDDDNSKS